MELGITKSKLERTSVEGREKVHCSSRIMVLPLGMVALELCNDKVLRTQQVNVGRPGMWLAGLWSLSQSRRRLICDSVKGKSSASGLL